MGKRPEMATALSHWFRLVLGAGRELVTKAEQQGVQRDGGNNFCQIWRIGQQQALPPQCLLSTASRERR